MTTDELLEQLAHPDEMRRRTAVRELSKRRPPPDLPGPLRRALLDEDDTVGREAAHALGKIGPAARDAADDLYAAATLPWKFGCPHRFVHAVGAMVRVAPDDPRLVPLIQDTIRCSNYGIQKACILALLALGTPEATDTLYHIDRYWRASPRSRPFKDLMAKAIAELARRAPTGERALDRERLARWVESPTGNRRRGEARRGSIAAESRK